MNERDFKDGLFTEYARIGKCLSSPKRLEILDILIQGPKSVEVLSKMTSMSVANVSQHLQTLYQAKLVQSKKQGNFVYYELSDSSVLHFLNSLYDLSEKQLIEVQHIKEQFLGQFSDVEGVTMEELAMRMEKGEVTLLDVRPRDEYETAHIPGAVSVPIEELAEQLSLLPADSKIVAYCRGPYCLMAVRAIALLQARGFEARHLDKSVHDWNDFIREGS
ncbi:metalloregulator ArsR/SmtB family transcription factor [Paenibacillus sp. FSL M8-0228]|uniref:ArsR/SmtB family transcription factor n=1 Tax=Paenibacillus TaxID=44249 RepID=UPI0003F5DFC1|nr:MULTISPECIES: metalloregulator ArsR/SmtB family transcription factor [Paenibacillus]MBO3282959.1 ArsR family transcriptional regulator [Paenibacillus polymyxa]ODB57022.1 ArsR family transcriptional regulator [Paenibacillus polymyxa]UMY55511.1 metalloregulator ArsR/SmtB family transcription factor [Paenibacillus peoriae]